MFKFDEDFSEEDRSIVTDELDRDYQLQPNDALILDVFTNKGESLIDPNFELRANQSNRQQQVFTDQFQYVIQLDGMINFPMVGDINLVGMTLHDAKLKVTEKFGEFYEDPFVTLSIVNRRVFILGALGGKVVPIPNENINLVEVLAQADGLQLGAKAQNIKLVRGKKIFVIDLSTISGFMNTRMNVESGDIIYVEPWRRPWLETLRDVSPTLSVISSILTLVIVVQNL